MKTQKQKFLFLSLFGEKRALFLQRPEASFSSEQLSAAEQKLQENVKKLSLVEREKLEEDLIYLANNDDTKERETKRKEATKDVLKKLGYTQNKGGVGKVHSELLEKNLPIFIETNFQESAARELLKKVQAVPKKTAEQFQEEIGQSQKNALKEKIETQQRIAKEKEEALKNVAETVSGESTSLELPKNLDYSRLAASIRLHGAVVGEGSSLKGVREIFEADIFPKAIARSVTGLQQAHAAEIANKPIFISGETEDSEISSVSFELEQKELLLNSPLGEMVLELAIAEAQKHEEYTEGTAGDAIKAAEKYIPQIMDSVMFTIQRIIENGVEDQKQKTKTIKEALGDYQEEKVVHRGPKRKPITIERKFKEFPYVQEIAGSTYGSGLYRLGKSEENSITVQVNGEHNGKPLFDVNISNIDNGKIRLTSDEVKQLIDGEVINEDGTVGLLRSGNDVLSLPVATEELDIVHAKAEGRNIAVSREYNVDTTAETFSLFGGGGMDDVQTSGEMMQDIVDIAQALPADSDLLAVTPEGQVFLKYDTNIKNIVVHGEGRVYERMADYYAEKSHEDPEKYNELRSLAITYDAITRHNGDAEIGNDYTKNVPMLKAGDFTFFRNLFSKKESMNFGEIMTKMKKEGEIPMGEMEMLTIFENLVLTKKIDLQKPNDVQKFWDDVAKLGEGALQSEDKMKEALEKNLTGADLDTYMKEFRKDIQSLDTTGDLSVVAGMFLLKEMGENTGKTADKITASEFGLENPEFAEYMNSITRTETKKAMEQVQQELGKEWRQTQENILSKIYHKGKPLVSQDQTWNFSVGLNVTAERNNYKAPKNEYGEWRETGSEEIAGPWQEISSALRTIALGSTELGREEVITDISFSEVEGNPIFVGSETTQSVTTGDWENTGNGSEYQAVDQTHLTPYGIDRYVLAIENTTEQARTTITITTPKDTYHVPVTITKTETGETVIQIKNDFAVVKDSELERTITTITSKERQVKTTKSVRRKREHNRELSFKALTEAFNGNMGKMMLQGSAGLGTKSRFDGSDHTGTTVDFLANTNGSIRLTDTTNFNSFLNLSKNLAGQGGDTASIGAGMAHKLEDGTFSWGASAGGMAVSSFFKNIVPKYYAQLSYHEDPEQGKTWMNGFMANIGLGESAGNGMLGLSQKKNPEEFSKKLDEVYAQFKAEMQDPAKKETFISYLSHAAFPGQSFTEKQAEAIHNDLYALYMNDDVGKAFFGELLERGITFGKNGANDSIALALTFVVSAKQEFMTHIETSDPAKQAERAELLASDIRAANERRNVATIPLSAYEIAPREEGWKTYSILPQGENFDMLTRTIPGSDVHNLREFRLKIHEDVADIVKIHEDGTFSVFGKIPFQISTTPLSGAVGILETHVGDPRREVASYSVHSPSSNLSAGEVPKLSRVGLYDKEVMEASNDIAREVVERLQTQQRLSVEFADELDVQTIDLEEDLEAFERIYMDAYSSYQTIRKSVFQGREAGGADMEGRLGWTHEQSEETMDTVLKAYISPSSPYIKQVSPKLRAAMEKFYNQGLSAENIMAEVIKRITATRSGKPTWSIKDRNAKRATFTEKKENVGLSLLDVAKNDLAKIFDIPVEDLADISLGCGNGEEGEHCSFTEATAQGDAELIETEYGAQGVLALSNYDRTGWEDGRATINKEQGVKENFVGINRIRTSHTKLYAKQVYTKKNRSGEEIVFYSGYYKECHNPALFAYKKPNATVLADSTDSYTKKGVNMKSIGAALGVTFAPKYKTDVAYSTETDEERTTRTENMQTSEEVDRYSTIREEREPLTKTEIVEETIRTIQETTQLPPNVTTETRYLNEMTAIWAEETMAEFNNNPDNVREAMANKNYGLEQAVAYIQRFGMGVPEQQAWDNVTNLPDDIRDIAAANSGFKGDKQELYNYLERSFTDINFTPPTKERQF